MANKAMDTSLVDKAIKFAVDAHAGTERRGKGFPYVIHVLEAMSITASYTNDPEILCASALHDTLEDTAVTEAQLRAEFSDKVADLVLAETDKFFDSEAESWRVRKQGAIDRLAGSSMEAKMVAIGDKLSNMRAIAADYRKMGDDLWSIFHAPGGKADHEWHYRGLAKSLGDLVGTDAYTEFCRLINEVFGKPAPELIDLADYEMSGDGYTAISYNHKNGRVMMKLYAPYIPAGVAERELVTTQAITNMKLGTPLAYRTVTDGKRYGVEFQRITGKRSFARAISQEPEKIEEYSRRFARMCRKLHSTQCDTVLFPSTEIRFLDAIERSYYSSEEKAKMKALLKSVPKTDNCLHGDMHIGNALIADGKEYWIDLSDFSYGNPMFDLGMMHFVCLGNPDEETAQRVYHISLEQLHRVWDFFVDEYFGHDADKDAIRERTASFAALYMVMYESRGMGISPEMKQFIKNTVLK